MPSVATRLFRNSNRADKTAIYLSGRITPLKCADTKKASASALESAHNFLLDLKSFGMCSYKKTGWGCPVGAVSSLQPLTSSFRGAVCALGVVSSLQSLTSSFRGAVCALGPVSNLQPLTSSFQFAGCALGPVSNLQPLTSSFQFAGSAQLDLFPTSDLPPPTSRTLG